MPAHEHDAMDLDLEPDAPKPIKKLDQDVINRIAAAEIIHRPANAVKELLENSIDAGATSVKITLKEGGLKMFQIVDNGCGIGIDSLPLLCTRYATSKLAHFSDLASLATYGFRGEALASVSFVCGKVGVVSKTRTQAVGYKAAYLNGELLGAASPSAANDGTSITAEDIFFNAPLRRKALKSATDEHNRVLDVVTRYAIHNPQISWTVKKANSSKPDLASPSASTTQQNISLLYGQSLGKELLEVKEKKVPALGIEGIRGWVTNPNWNQKRLVFLLFINHRLVESTKIRKAVESVYGMYLPKGSFPWVYLSLEIAPANIDVNVHPTKQEVHFLNEEEVVEAVVAEVSKTLTNANSSRNYHIQTLLPGSSDPKSSQADRPDSSARPKKPAPQHKVRLDPLTRTLDSMPQFALRNPSQVTLEPSQKRRKVGDGGVIDVDVEEEDELAGGDGEKDGEEGEVGDGGDRVEHGGLIEESEVVLKSVKRLRGKVSKDASTELNEIFATHSFIGFVEVSKATALIQQGAKLFLLHYDLFADELFYQLGLRQFGALGKIKLDPAPDLRQLIRIAVENEPGLVDAGFVPAEMEERIYNQLVERREMLMEYFSFDITEDGRLESLPMLLPGYIPSLDRLPYFLMCLGVKVDWSEESACFETFLLELALYYSPRNLSLRPKPPSPDPDTSMDIDSSLPTDAEVEHEKYQVRHVLFPAFRKYARFSKELAKAGEIRQLAELSNLYKIFERC